MIYHASGAINCIDADGDSLKGYYNADGYRRIIIAGSGSGLYDASGAIRVTNATAETSPVGAYAADGSWNVTFVDGTTLVGAYAPNGSNNCFLNLGTPLLNGGFDTDTVWLTQSGWTIADGVATVDSAIATLIQQSITFVEDGVYRITFDVTDYTQGLVHIRITGGTTVDGSVRSAVGTYSEDITALAGNNALNFRAGANSTLSIDNVTVVRIS